MGQDVEHRSLPVYAAGSVDVPFVIDGFDEIVERDTRWGEHSHPTHELVWNERGASSITVRSRTWAVTPGLGLWIPAGTLHSAAAPASTWYRATHFGIADAPLLSSDPVAVEITPLLRLLLERLDDPGLTEHSRAVTESMVIDTVKPSSRELLVNVPESELLAPIVRAAQQAPGACGALSHWAEALGVSSRTITRAFRAETGLGFVQWVGTVRAQRAILLLARGAELEDIAEEVGYSSVSAFGAAFRRTTGLTPGAFRPA